jgi:hypothetical protein
MILIDVLFALTVAMIAFALIAGRVPEQKADDRFIEYFGVLLAVLLILGSWLVPLGKVPAWIPALSLGVFAVIFIVSVVMTVSGPRIPSYAAARGTRRHDVEAAVVDSGIWLIMLAFGIAMLGRFHW